MKPIKFKIRDIEFTLQKVNWNDENLLLNDNYRAGITHRRTAEIYISNDLTPEITRRVLIHELTHAFVFACGMIQVDWKEENVADFIESNIFEIQGIYEKVIEELLK